MFVPYLRSFEYFCVHEGLQMHKENVKGPA